jgi:hypothetical protein
MDMIEILTDATVLSEYGVLIRCDIRAKLVERSELKCLMCLNFIYS